MKRTQVACASRKYPITWGPFWLDSVPVIKGKMATMAFRVLKIIMSEESNLPLPIVEAEFLKESSVQIVAT